MRVVAGIAKGRRLVAPRGDTTRPTSDFVREAVFNSLASQVDLDGARVLDLFAGTGALGIEALSRGAAHVDFVESHRRAVDAIQANLATTGLSTAALATATVHQADVVPWLQRHAANHAEAGVPSFTVAFVDPPYAWDLWSELRESLRLVVPAGVAVLESDRAIDLGEGWRVLKSKNYGTTVVTLASPRSCP
jgi:16S rRNA (guanine966-N2)-methyltransferase